MRTCIISWAVFTLITTAAIGARAADTTPAAPVSESAAAVRDWRYLVTIDEIARADDDEHLARLVNDNPDRVLLRLADGRTPVHVAAEAGALKSLRVLGKAGADLNVMDSHDRTALAIAVGMNFVNTARTLMELGADVNRPAAADESSRTRQPPLTIAAMRGNAEMLKLLLDAKVDVNRKGADGGTALTASAAAHHWDTVNLLLDKGADANLPNGDGVTALLFATEAGDEKTVAALLAHGADPRRLDNAGRAALSLTQSPALWKMLIAHGADVNVVVKGETPLQYFITTGNAGLVRAWLEYKPDPFVTDRKGLTAKELARKFATGAPPGSIEARRDILLTVEDYQKRYAAEMDASENPATTPAR